MTVGVCILAGGLSERMGEDKAMLSLPGEEVSYIQKIASTVDFFEEKLISIREKEYQVDGFRCIRDMTERIGPMGGIYSALQQCESDALLVLACDMPFFTKECAEELLNAFMNNNCDICLCVSSSGIEPLASIYHKRCMEVIERKMHVGDYRLRSLFSESPIIKVEISDSKSVYNINTREDILGVKKS